MCLGAIDYASSYFKYKTPTPIRGVPTHKTIKRLKLELRANGSSVETDLGGGNHGYLGLLCTDEEYAEIPHAQPFVPPNYPGPLTIPSTATAMQAMQLREDHREAKRLYFECKNVEKALLRHIQDALEDKYIECMVDEYTNLISEDISTVLNYLMTTFGIVSSEEVAQKEAEVMSMTWIPSDPIILLARPLEQLKKLSLHAGVPYTDAQILEKGLSIIRATRDFEYALTTWENRSVTDKNWKNFKTHFHDAQVQLRKIRGPTMQQAGFHQANSLAQKISTDIQQQLNDRDNHMMAMLQSIPGLTESSSDADSSSQEPTEYEVANVSQQNNQVQLEILRLLKEIRTDLQKKPSRRGATPASPQTRTCPKMERKCPDNGGKLRRNITKYCWTHGAGGHTGQECPNRAPGHKETATFQNKMDGSKARCS